MSLFKKTSQPDTAAEAYRRTSELLLQAIGLHAVEGEPQEYHSFQSTIKELQAKVNAHAPLAEGVVAASVAAKAMQDYGRRTTQFIKAQNLELQGVIEMLVETVIHLGAPNGRSIPVLRELGGNLRKASSIEEIRTLRLRLAECLDAARAEAADRRRAASSAREIQTHEELTPVAGGAALQEIVQQLDPATHLPVRTEAEAGIREMMQDGKHAFAAVFVVDRVHSINSRFGCPVGDQVMLAFLDRITKGLIATDRIFRWAEASFLALMVRSEQESEIRRQIERILFRRFEEIFVVGSRPVLLPISATWSIVPLSEPTSELVIRKIDTFARQTAP